MAHITMPISQMVTSEALWLMCLRERHLRSIRDRDKALLQYGELFFRVWMTLFTFLFTILVSYP